MLDGRRGAYGQEAIARHQQLRVALAHRTVPVPGRAALADAGDRVAAIEQHCADLIGHPHFANTCCALPDLLDALEQPEP